MQPDFSQSTSPALAFPGFPAFRANVTYCPVQFFTVTLPHSSRGCVRLVSYMIRRILGWVDEHGNPTEERLVFTHSELSEAAGISRRAVPEVLEEALERRFIHCCRTPRSDALGRAARSGAYELLWDEVGSYTDRLEDFRGFYYPEAWIGVETDNGTAVCRPKASRKNIPNAFFDVVIPKEPLSIIRTVGALLFYSIQWGKGGERKDPVSKSITELSNLTKLSRHHTHDALTSALEAGYLQRLLEGFGDRAGQESRPATYAIRWQEDPVRMSDPTSLSQGAEAEAGQKGVRDFEADRCKKVHGEAVQKGARDRCKKVHGKRCKKVHDIILKLDPKTSDPKTAADDPTAIQVPKRTSVAAAAVRELERVGFDLKTARALASGHPAEVITQQIEWLAKRTVSANPLGMLRRAIEENWPEPKAPEKLAAPESGRVFAEHFYGAYQGTPDQPATNLFRNDAVEATRFLAALGVSDAPLETAMNLGRRFGHFVRGEQGRDAKAKPYLSAGLVQFGSAFRKKLRLEVQTDERTAREAAKEAHQAAFAENHMAYIAAAEKRCQEGNRAFYEGFITDWQRRCEQMARGPIRLSPETLARLQTDAARLHAFFDFCRKSPGFEILDFWEWDARENPAPLQQGATQ